MLIFTCPTVIESKTRKRSLKSIKAISILEKNPHCEKEKKKGNILPSEIMDI